MIARRTLFIAGALLVLLIGIGYVGIRYTPAWLAVRFAPEKTAQASTTALAQQARQAFQEAFYGARYEELPEITRLLTAAYLDNPRDPQIALYLAQAHLWALGESARRRPDPRVTDHAIVADKYFTEAQRLNPADKRIQGWLAGIKLALGSIHQDEKLTREGYFMLREAIQAFPEFNFFTASFVLSGAPVGSERFTEAVDYAWKNIEACVGRRIDRQRWDSQRQVTSELTTGPKRICHNSPLVPHNFEGFFLHFGDVLTKQGDTVNARKAYEVALRSGDFASWPYREVLQARLTDLEERARRFQDPDPGRWPETMFRSSYSCAGCHAR